METWIDATTLTVNDVVVPASLEVLELRVNSVMNETDSSDSREIDAAYALASLHLTCRPMRFWVWLLLEHHHRQALVSIDRCPSLTGQLFDRRSFHSSRRQFLWIQIADPLAK